MGDNLFQNGEFSQDITPTFNGGYRYINSDNSAVPHWNFNAIIATGTFFSATPPIPLPQRAASLQSGADPNPTNNNISQQLVGIDTSKSYTLSLYAIQRYDYQAEYGYHGSLNILVDNVSITPVPIVINNWGEWDLIEIKQVNFTSPSPIIKFEQPYSEVAAQGSNDITTSITGISLNIYVALNPEYSQFTLPNITLGSLPYTITSSNLTSTSPAPITYTSSDPDIASVSGGVITANSAGPTGTATVTITASQEETDGYNAGSTNTQLTVIASSSSNPTQIQTGSSLIYFMESDAQYAQITNNSLEITQDLIGSNYKTITTNNYTSIAKI